MRPKAKAVTAHVLVIAQDLAVAHVYLIAVLLVVITAKVHVAIHVTMGARNHATDVKPLKDKVGILSYSHIVSFCFGKYKDNNVCCN